MIGNRKYILGIITRKDITHWALDEGAATVTRPSTNTTRTSGHYSSPNPDVQRLVSLDQESTLAATVRTRSASGPHETELETLREAPSDSKQTLNVFAH